MASGSLLNDNLAFLQEYFPEINRRLKTVSPIPFETSRSGHPTFKLNGRFIHSAYDPVREEESRFRSSGYGDQKVLVFIGLGAGYGLLSCAGLRNKRLIVIEEKPDYFLLSLQVVDYRSLASGNELVVSLGPEIPDMSVLLENTPPRDIFVLEQRPLVSENPSGFYRTVAESFRLFLKRQAADINTAGYFSFLWFLNTLRNLRRLPASYDLNGLKNSFAEHPAAVVSAGPTLETSLEILRKAAGRGTVVICAAAAARRLKNAGIEPHFIVSTDAGYYNSWNTRTGGMGKSVLVSDLSVHPLTEPRNGPDRTMFFDFRLGFGRCLLDALEAGFLPAFTMAGTVASSCLELAAFLGCKEISLFGQDFGFPGWLSHCRSTIHETWALGRQDRMRTLETSDASLIMSESLSMTKDYSGQPVATSVKHLLYRDWFAKTWKGAGQISPASVATGELGLVEKLKIPSGLDDPFTVIEKTLRPVKFPRPGKDVPDRLRKTRAALEKAGSAEGFFSSADPAIVSELRSALGFELSRTDPSGPLPGPLRRKIFLSLSVMHSVLQLWRT